MHGMRYTLAELEALPTLSTSQTDNLKFDDGLTRVWLSRTTTADGEPYDHKVTIERQIDFHWVVEEQYPASA